MGQLMDGLFVNEDKAYYAILNGSLYEVDPFGDFPPGYYDAELNPADPGFAKYDPNQPRAPEGTEEGGQWVDDPTKPRVLDQGPRELQRRLRALIEALPDDHMQLVGNLDVKIVRRIAPSESLGDAGYVLGQFHFPAFQDPYIEIAEGYTYYPGGQKKSAGLRSQEQTLVHELGHALDRTTSWRMSEVLSKYVIRDAQALTKSLNKRQARLGTYWLSSRKEMFAELYALAYTPGTTGKFFGVKRKTAEQKFARSLEAIKKAMTKQ